MAIYMESWWGRLPMKCSCCRTLSVEVIDSEHMVFHCKAHGLVVEGIREAKRGGSVDWHYHRLFKDYTGTKLKGEPIQLSLL